MTRLNAAGVPAGPILTVPEALALEQVRGRDFLRAFPETPGVDKTVTNARAGYQMDGAAPDVGLAPPALGQDTDAILTDLGYEAGDIADLRADGVI